ncbi:MAG TPA: hypothetical protein VKE74_19670 [Gemmataceae bacterium]|nr:hypothetical protein [Gemmataceae bacterium]
MNQTWYESKWHEYTGADLLRHLPDGSRSGRKARLAAVACIERWSAASGSALRANLLDLALRLADGEASEPERAEAYRAVPEQQTRDREEENRVFHALLSVGGLQAGVEVLAALRVMWYTNELTRRREAWAAYTVIIRDIFGNPFRIPAFDPNWRTSTAVALSRQMYDSHEFSAMPILADALQDAGCEHEDILDHCREAQATHVRGCWVVDLVLGK